MARQVVYNPHSFVILAPEVRSQIVDGAANAANGSARKQPKNSEHKENVEGGPSKRRRGADRPAANTQRSVMQRFQQNQEEMEHHQTRLRTQRMAGTVAMQSSGTALNGLGGAPLWASSPPFPTSASSEGARDNGLTPPQHGPTPPSSMPLRSTSAAVVGMMLEQEAQHSVFPPDVHMQLPNDGKPEMSNVPVAQPPVPPSYPSVAVAATPALSSHSLSPFQQQSAPQQPSHSSSAFPQTPTVSALAGGPVSSYVPPTPYSVAAASSTIPYSMHAGPYSAGGTSSTIPYSMLAGSPALRPPPALSTAGARAGEIVSSVKTEMMVMAGAPASRTGTNGANGIAAPVSTSGRPVMSAAAAIAAANPNSAAALQQQRPQPVGQSTSIPVPNWQNLKQPHPQQQAILKQEFARTTVQQRDPPLVEQKVDFRTATASKSSVTVPQPVFQGPPRPSTSFAPSIPAQQPRPQIPLPSSTVASYLKKPQQRAAQTPQILQQHRSAAITAPPSMQQHQQRPSNVPTPSFAARPQPQLQQQRPVAPPAAPASSSYLPVTQVPSPVVAPVAAAPPVAVTAAAPSKFFDDDDDWDDDALQVLEQVEKQHLSLSQPAPAAIPPAQTSSAEPITVPVQPQPAHHQQPLPAHTMSNGCVTDRRPPPPTMTSPQRLPLQAQPTFGAVAPQLQRAALPQQQHRQQYPVVTDFRSSGAQAPVHQPQQVRPPQQFLSMTAHGTSVSTSSNGQTSSLSHPQNHRVINGTVTPPGGMRVGDAANHVAAPLTSVVSVNGWRAPPVQQQQKQPQQQFRPVVAPSHVQPQRPLTAVPAVQAKPSVALPAPSVAAVVPPPAQNIWISSQWA